MPQRSSLFVLFLLFLFCGSAKAWQTDPASDKNFKLSLLQLALKQGNERGQANRFGVREPEDEMLLEVATAIGADDIYRSWLQGATTDNERQFVMSTVAKHAAYYGRTNLAVGLTRQLASSTTKLESICHSSFALGQAAKRSEVELLINDLRRMHQTAAAQPPGGKARQPSEVPFSENNLAQWKETVWLCFHCGWANSERPLSDQLQEDISTILFRDTVRAYRVRHHFQYRDVDAALGTIREMESPRLQINLLLSLLRRPDPDPATQDHQTLGLGQHLFETYLNLDDQRKYAKSDAFTLFQESDLNSFPVDGIPIIASEMMGDDGEFLKASLSATEVLGACVQSGYCRDGLDKVKRIDDDEKRADWLHAVVSQYEQNKDFRSAWATFKRFQSDLTEAGYSEQTYLARLIKLACVDRDFELAVDLKDQVSDSQTRESAKFVLACHRQNESDIAYIDANHKQVFVDFKKQLSTIQAGKQLDWLFNQGFKLSEEKLCLLTKDINQEVALRKDDPSRDYVARKIRNSINSMTPIGVVRTRFMRHLANALAIDLSPRRYEGDGELDATVSELNRLAADAPLDTKKKLLTRYLVACKKHNVEPNTIGPAAKIALLYASVGNYEETEKTLQNIADPKYRFHATLNCIIALPPATKPVYRWQAYRQRMRQGGFHSGGFM